MDGQTDEQSDTKSISLLRQMTPLLNAAGRGYLDVVEQLIKLGARVSIFAKHYRKILHFRSTTKT